jgi:hypothetical protein
MELSFDAGFGDTKYILKKDNGEIIKEKFPTAIEKVSIKAKGDKDVYNYNNKVSYYRVGERAVKNASITRDMDYLIKISPLLVYHILKKNEIEKLEEPLKLRTGLSLFYYNEYKEKFKQTLKEFVVDGNKITTQIGLFAQGQGILYDYLDKNDTDAEEIVVIDIGYNTIDFLHFINENGSYIPFKANCFGIDEGAYLAVSELKDFIEAEYGITLTEQQTNKILNTKQIKVGGEISNLSEIVDEIKKSYTERIINDIVKVRKKLISSVDKIIFGGGGAYFLDLDELNKFHKGITIIDEPEFANVRGYLKKKIKGDKK